jgi:hypothetical protein
VLGRVAYVARRWVAMWGEIIRRVEGEGVILRDCGSITPLESRFEKIRVDSIVEAVLTIATARAWSSFERRYSVIIRRGKCLWGAKIDAGSNISLRVSHIDPAFVSACSNATLNLFIFATYLGNSSSGLRIVLDFDSFNNH